MVKYSDSETNFVMPPFESHLNYYLNLESGKIPLEWENAKVVSAHKKWDQQILKN